MGLGRDWAVAVMQLRVESCWHTGNCHRNFCALYDRVETLTSLLFLLGSSSLRRTSYSLA